MARSKVSVCRLSFQPRVSPEAESGYGTEGVALMDGLIQELTDTFEEDEP